MKLQGATRRETLHIGLGVLAGCVVMNLIYLVLGKWGLPTLWGTLLGGGWAVLNFLLLGLTVQAVAADTNEGRGRSKMQLSYSLRMLGTLGVAVLGFLLPCFSWPAAVLPLLMPRLTILVMQLLGLYRPSKEKADAAEKPAQAAQPAVPTGLEQAQPQNDTAKGKQK